MAQQMTPFQILFALLCVLNLLDLLTTMVVLHRGGTELNPIYDFLFSKVTPVVGLLAIKVPMLAVVWFYANLLTLYLANAFFLGVVLWNIYQLRRSVVTALPNRKE